MTSSDSFVDQNSRVDQNIIADEEDHFGRWLDTPVSPDRSRESGSWVDAAAVTRPLEHSRLTYPRRLELSPDSRRTRLFDWVLSASVRRGVLTVTTCGMLALGAWLLATALSGSNSPGMDFGAFGSVGGSPSAAPIDSGSEPAEGAVQSAASATVGKLDAVSVDGRVQLVASPSEAGWTIDVVDSVITTNQAAAVRLVVNGQVIDESGQLPFQSTIARDGNLDVSAVIVSVVVDWVDESAPGSPVALAISSDQ